MHMCCTAVWIGLLRVTLWGNRSVHTLPAELLECSTGSPSVWAGRWCPDATARVSAEYCGSFSIWRSSTPSPHHSNSSLAAAAAESMFFWRLRSSCENVSTRLVLYRVTDCIDWKYPTTNPLTSQPSFAFYGPTVWNGLPSAMRNTSYNSLLPNVFIGL